MLALESSLLTASEDNADFELFLRNLFSFDILLNNPSLLEIILNDLKGNNHPKMKILAEKIERYPDAAAIDDKDGTLNDLYQILYYAIKPQNIVSIHAVTNISQAFCNILRSSEYDVQKGRIINSAQLFILNLEKKQLLHDESIAAFEELSPEISFCFNLKNAIMQNMTTANLDDCKAHQLNSRDLETISSNTKNVSAENLIVLANYSATTLKEFDLTRRFKLLALNKANPKWSKTPNIIDDDKEFYLAYYNQFNDGNAAYWLFEYYACIPAFQEAICWLKRANDANSHQAKSAVNLLRFQRYFEHLEEKDLDNDNFQEYLKQGWMASWEKPPALFAEQNDAIAIPYIFRCELIASINSEHAIFKHPLFANTTLQCYARLLEIDIEPVYHDLLEQRAPAFFLLLVKKGYLTGDANFCEWFKENDFPFHALYASMIGHSNKQHQPKNTQNIFRDILKIPYSDKIATLLYGAISNDQKARRAIVELFQKNKHPYFALFFMLPPNHNYPAHQSILFNQTAAEQPNLAPIKEFLIAMGIKLTDQNSEEFLTSLYQYLPGALFSKNTTDMMDLAALLKSFGNVYAHAYWIARATEAGNEDARTELLSIMETLVTPKDALAPQSSSNDSVSGDSPQEEPSSIVEHLKSYFNRLIDLANSAAKTDKTRYDIRAYIVLILIHRVFSKNEWLTGVPKMTGETGILPYAIGMDINKHFGTFKNHLEKYKVFHYGLAQRKKGTGKLAVKKNVGPQTWQSPKFGKRANDENL